LGEWPLVRTDPRLITIGYMEWIIERISTAEESVYLRKPLVGTTRKISVPGALNARLEGDRLIILASTGFVWEVNPDTGHRKRHASLGSSASAAFFSVGTLVTG
jgi:hypothetical protein